VAGTATRADLERALTQAATRADVDEITARAIWPVATSLQQLIEAAPPSQNSIRHTLKRLTDAIEAAEAVVEAAELSRPERDEAAELSRPERDEAAADAGNDPEVDDPAVPDASEIWGEEGKNGATARSSDRDHHRKSPTRRRLERSGPGRAYTNWKYRRSELG
jgi:hypothetical protein